MAEGDDYTPAPWAAQHDFKSARATYDRNAGRSYEDAKERNVTASDLVPARIATKSRHPLLIWCDTTGSMGEWPGVMFSKIPYLEFEMRTEYLGEDAEVSFGSITDTGDEYPLQVRPFVKGEDLTASLNAIVRCGGGSGPGTYCESYAVAALYACRNVEFPRAAGKPTMIIIGDEMPYDLVSRSDAKTFAKVDMEETRLSADAIFKELTARYSVYLILKPYGGERLSGDELHGVTKDVYERWVKILGAGRIAFLPQAERVVDVIFGILAKEADKVDYFREEIERRQRPDQVATVYKSLLTVHAEDPVSKPKPGASTMHKPAGGKRSKGLLDK